MGLDEILAELYSEGRPAIQDTAGEIIKRLEDRKNYIPSSEATRREYRHLLVEAYEGYVGQRAEDSR